MTQATRAERLELIGSAAAGLAHDLNNQLTLIVNHLDAKDLDGARAAAQQCAELVEAVLEWGRGNPPQACAIKPGPFLRQYCARLRLPPGVFLTPAIMPYLPSIWADPVGLTRALNNLISNSCQAMGNVGIIRIRATDLAIEVRDSGPGIPPDVARRAFEPFFTTRGEHGTGLGLAIVRETMRQCGGSVELDTACNIGARFTLRFRKP
jgi:two-component system cell cycle sensor histidine kinase/response regulator CckA